MKELNFKEFTVPTDIRREHHRTGDARESFANLIYKNVNGIRAHALAFKIYQSEGVEAYSPEEVRLIREVAERLCAPNFIDGLNAQLEGGGDESNI